MARVWSIPLTDVDLDDREIEAVTAVLRSKWLSMGEVTHEFERAFAGYIGTSHAIAVSSGTAALHLAYTALGLGPGDEVIMPSLTFVATANAAVALGAIPVFADVTSETDLTLAPAGVAQRMTKRTRAIMAVHYGGYPCNMEELLSIARDNELAVIEDCAHSPGAQCAGVQTGALADAGCFSFFANKNMTTGEGGMVTTSRDDLAATIRLARSHGMTSTTIDRRMGDVLTYDVLLAGHNFRMDEIRAALGLVQLAKLETANRRRAEVVQCYRRALQAHPDVGVPFATKTHSSFHLMTVLLPEGTDRVALMRGMHAAGIQTSVHYPPIHRMTYYRNANVWSEGLEITERIQDRLLTLPLSPAMSENAVDRVVAALQTALRRAESRIAR